jgi:hypothetical protein
MEIVDIMEDNPMRFELSFYKDKKVFITGHTGFKGSWLCKMLATAGAVVTGYSLEPPTSPSLFEIADIEQDIHSVIGDIRDYEALKATFDEAHIGLCVIAGVLGVSCLKFKPVIFFGDYLLKILLGISITAFMLAMNVHIKIGNKVSRFLGNISYEIYLLHGIVFGLIGYMIPQINSGMFIVLGIVITIGISVIVHGMSKAILK